MPVRITPKGVLLITWDDNAQEWVSLGNTERIYPCLMSGLKSSMEPSCLTFLDAVDRDGEIKMFLGSYC
jgi:hypothetical protein